MFTVKETKTRTVIQLMGLCGIIIGVGLFSVRMAVPVAGALIFLAAVVLDWPTKGGDEDGG